MLHSCILNNVPLDRDGLSVREPVDERETGRSDLSRWAHIPSIVLALERLPQKPGRDLPPFACRMLQRGLLRRLSSNGVANNGS